MRVIKIDNVKKFADNFSRKQPQNKKIIEKIINDVKNNGDAAIKRYEKKFSNANIVTIRMNKKEIKSAYNKVSQKEIDAINYAKDRLKKTELATRSIFKNKTITDKDVKITKEFIPINSVGCYIPGGQARYPSSAIMSIIPAKVAGVKRIVAVSPPNAKNQIDPLSVVAADICGADEIYKTGGAQAIAALSFGTKSISKVDKIVGPGGIFVTMAKLAQNAETAIDMAAGPTELGILADDGANSKVIALDLISQAEHSRDTTCYVITTSMKLCKSISQNVQELVPNVKRSKIIHASLKNNGFIAVTRSKKDMVLLANLLAPEHLQIMTKNPKALARQIDSAGLVLIGANTPSSASDYMLGSNHILPTCGFAKSRGALGVLDFLKITTRVECSKKTLERILKHMQVLTTSEELENHYNAVRGRLV